MELKVLKPIFAESASKLVNIASKHSDTILIKKDHWVVDAKSLLGVLALALLPGQVVEFSLETEGKELKELYSELISSDLFEEV